MNYAIRPFIPAAVLILYTKPCRDAFGRQQSRLTRQASRHAQLQKLSRKFISYHFQLVAAVWKQLAIAGAA